jgi:hypothetical protein
MEALRAKLVSGTGYATQVEYDADSERYTALVTRYNQYVEDFGTISEVYRYIMDHQDDRIGVSGRIANSKVENLL